MLRKGQNGNEILTILDMIVGSVVSSEPTLEEIDFWLVLLIIQGVDKLSPHPVYY